MRVLRLFMVASGILLAVVASAQAPSKFEAPYRWKCEGDSVETFKASLVPAAAADQSTARGTVQAYLGLCDGRASAQQANAVELSYRSMLTEKALAALEEQLLAAPIREAAAKARRDALETKPHISAEAAEIVSEEQAENGNVVLETKQQVTREDMDESGEAKQTTSESRARYSCVKGEDGKWRITQLERAIRDRRTGKSGWQTWTGMAGNAYAALTERFPEPEVLKQDTEESAARSLFCSLLATDVACRRRTEAVTIAAFLKELEPLLTTDFIAAAKQTGDDNAGGSTTMPRFEIESAKTDADGRAVIQFKQTESWRNLVQLTLEQANNKWRVVSAATSDPPSEDGQEPSYEPVVNMYDLRTP